MPTRHPTQQKKLSNLRARFFVFATGLFSSMMGAAYLRRGIFSFTNASYHQTVFSAGVVGSGIVLMVFALLPTGDSIFRRITTRRELKFTHHNRHSHVNKTTTDSLERNNK
jgi:hypothetical protein